MKASFLVLFLVPVLLVAGCVGQTISPTPAGSSGTEIQPTSQNITEETTVPYRSYIAEQLSPTFYPSTPKSIEIKNVTPLMIPNGRFGLPIIAYFNKTVDEYDDRVGISYNGVLTAMELWTNATDGSVIFLVTDDPRNATMTVNWATRGDTAFRILGFGGPTEVVDTGLFNFSKRGEITLRIDKYCLSTTIHELGHVLGLGHVDDENSLMYPTQENGACDIPIDKKSIETVKEIYKTPSLPELYFEDVNATKVDDKIYASFAITNAGLKDSGPFKVLFWSKSKNKTFTEYRNFSSLEPGWGIMLENVNIDVDTGTNTIQILIDADNEISELDEDNNYVTFISE